MMYHGTKIHIGIVPPLIWGLSKFNLSIVAQGMNLRVILADSLPTLNLNFLKGMFWAYEWLLKANSFKKKVLGMSQ